METGTPLQLFDPKKRTLAEHTWNVPITCENVVAIGYPLDSENYPNGAVSYGKTLSDLAATNKILELKQVGDS